MSSDLRQAIDDAFRKKLVPEFTSGDVRSLGEALGLSPPISVRDIVSGLQGLPGQQMLFATGPLGPSTVTAFAQLMISSEGFWSFRGSIHESGAVGHNYALGMSLLDLKDSSGQVVSFKNEGTVHGRFEFGSSDDNWQQDNQNQLIADNWEIAKNSGMHYDIEVSTDALDVIEAALIGALVAAALTGLAFFIGNPNTHCKWSPSIGPDDKGQPAAGAGVSWEQQ